MELLKKDPIFTTYLALPYINEISECEDTPLSEAECKTTGEISYKGQIFYSRAIDRIDYIAGKLLPSFDKGETYLDFGFGLKKMDNALPTDMKRMDHTFQHNPVPRSKTIKPQGIHEVYKALYRAAGYDDDLFFRISQVYNQRIGIDLLRLARHSMDIYTQDPQLDSQKAHLDLYVYDDDVVISAYITGQVRAQNDEGEVEILPIHFRVEGVYNVTKDLCFQKVEFEKIT